MTFRRGVRRHPPIGSRSRDSATARPRHSRCGRGRLAQARREASGGERGGFDAVGHAELAEDVGHVDAGCLGADEEFFADLAVGTAAGEQLEHLELAWRETETVCSRLVVDWRIGRVVGSRAAGGRVGRGSRCRAAAVRRAVPGRGRRRPPARSKRPAGRTAARPAVPAGAPRRDGIGLRLRRNGSRAPSSRPRGGPIVGCRTGVAVVRAAPGRARVGDVALLPVAMRCARASPATRYHRVATARARSDRRRRGDRSTRRERTRRGR